MEVVLYPYKLARRTEYSKYQVFDENGKNISTTAVGKKILEDYNKQKSNPDKYFDIKENVLIKVLDNVKKDKINYLFIPHGVKKINDKAVEKQPIKLVSLPDTIEETGKDAFYSCTSLKSVAIPSSIVYMDKMCFRSCEEIETVKLPEDLRVLYDCMFINCPKLEKINIPDSLREIRSRCFQHCESLKNIYLPDTVETIEEGAFSGCKSLEHIRLPKALKTISDGVFYGCEKLSEIDLPGTVTKIGSEAFAKTYGLSSIAIPKDLDTVDIRPFFVSGIRTLIFNHDLKSIKNSPIYKEDDPKDLLRHSEINKLVINKNVKVITPLAVDDNGVQITEIDYLGTKEEFEKFKKQNSELFELLPNLKEINFGTQEKESISCERLER